MGAISRFFASSRRFMYKYMEKYSPYSMPNFVKYKLYADDTIDHRGSYWTHEGYNRLSPEEHDAKVQRCIMGMHRYTFDKPFPPEEWIKPEEEKNPQLDHTLLTTREIYQQAYWNRV